MGWVEDIDMGLVAGLAYNSGSTSFEVRYEMGNGSVLNTGTEWKNETISIMFGMTF